MVTRSMFVVIVLIMLSLLPQVTSAQTHAEGEFMCKPSNILASNMSAFQYVPDLNVLAVAYAGEVIFYDISTYHYELPGTGPNGDTINFTELFRVPFQMGNYQTTNEAMKLSFSIVPIDKESGIVVLNYPQQMMAIRFTLKDGLTSDTRFFKWNNGAVWTDGSKVYLRWPSITDPMVFEYAFVYFYGDGLYLQDLYEDELLPEAFDYIAPRPVSAQLLREWGDGQRHIISFGSMPELLAMTGEMLIVQSDSLVAACPQDHSQLPAKFRSPKVDSKANEEKWYLPPSDC